ncbi:hypothetical protein GCM10009760_38220 [Kitasatospora kazusensis]|uniref:Uncharacterized protein n=1 Tax=Kitasatospora kazusensis TaxID=407974 RepID=A0ABN2ZTM2_9ACTN
MTGPDRLLADTPYALREQPRREPAAAPPDGADGLPWRRLMTAPAPFPSEHQQAAHELDLLAALVLAQPPAAASLDLLVNDRHIHPEGALVLGALLQVTGHPDGAQLWWQFAAGGGNYTAASCLNLLHRSRGEPLDADFWRLQAEQLAADPRPVRQVLDSPRELLPRHVRADIIARCHEGLDLRLPPRLAAVVNQLPVHGDDEDYGEIRQLSAGLVRNLADAAAGA